MSSLLLNLPKVGSMSNAMSPLIEIHRKISKRSIHIDAILVPLAVPILGEVKFILQYMVL